MSPAGDEVSPDQAALDGVADSDVVDALLDLLPVLILEVLNGADGDEHDDEPGHDDSGLAPT